MKRVICLLLCMSMLLAAVPALAAISYTLPEKMEKQLSIGSGLKGTFSLHGEGNDPLILSLSFLQDTEFQIRSLLSGNDLLCSVYQTVDGDEQRALTELYRTGNQFYLRSSLLSEDIYKFPGMEEIADALRKTDKENPPFASALIRWLQLDEGERVRLLEPVTDMLGREMEIWLAHYADVSEVRTLENGISAVDLSYHIPSDDLKTEIINLLGMLLQDSQGQALIDSVLNDEQKKIYANPGLNYFYKDALDALDDSFDIQYTRTVSTLGETVSSLLELPLDEERVGFSSLEIEENNGMVSYTLRNEEGFISLIHEREIILTQSDDFSVWLYMRRSEDDKEYDAHALRIEIHHQTELSSDEENRNHQTDRWLFRTEKDLSRLPEEEKENTAQYPDEPPIILDATMHYYSRNSQSSPTNLDIQVLLEKQDLSLSLSAKLKTASPWEFHPFDTNGAIEWLSLSEDARILKLTEGLSQAMEQIQPGSSLPREDSDAPQNDDP